MSLYRALQCSSILICFCICAPIVARENRPDYSKEGFVIEKLSKDVTFAADGTWRCEQMAAVRVQSESGVRQFGVLSFSYKSDKQRIDVDYLRVRKSDGSVINTPASNIQDVSSEVTTMAPTYSDFREKQIPVKGLSAGDTLEYKIALVQTKPEVPNQFWYSQDFLTEAVVLEETLRIAVPAGKYVKVVSPTLKPEISEQAGWKIYFWRTAQLAPASQNDGKKKKTEISRSRSVQLTTFKSWEEVGRWYAQLEAPRVIVTPAIQAKATELTQGLTAVSDKQRVIYSYVSSKFRYISISFGIGRYQPHAAAEVLSNQYGDCKDKHTLLAALLKAVGIGAWPALIGAGEELDPSVPSPAQFNHVITVVPEKNEYLWLDTTPEVAPFGLIQASLRGKQALVIPSNGSPVLVPVPTDPPFRSTEEMEVSSTLSAEGTLTAHFDITARGDSELLYRNGFHQFPPARWQQLMQTTVNTLGFGGNVSNVEVENLNDLGKPLHYSFDYVRKNYSDWPDRRINPPLFPIEFYLGKDDEKPADSIMMGAPGEIRFRATVRLSKDFSAELPAVSNVRTDFADYTANYSVRDGMLSVERRLVIKHSKLPVSAWDDYLKFEDKVLGDERQWVQLAASNGTSATTVVQNNAEAEALVQQAVQSLQNRDTNAARDELAQADRLNPKQRGLWAAYGLLYFIHGDMQRGVDALHKEIQNHPDNIAVYRVLAEAELQRGRRDEAIDTLRTLVKMTPDDVYGVSRLSSLLMAKKDYKEVPNLVERALAHSPDDQQLQVLMVEALLRAGRKDEGVAAAQKLVKNVSDGSVFNNAAWFLVDTNTDLSLAKEYAERAVSLLEGESKNVALANLSNDDLHRVVALAAAWDTLGWTYFQLGDVANGERYVTASWRLSQRGDVADHLGQIYAREGKQQAAIHAWKLALSADPRLDDTRERLRNAGVSSEPDRPRLTRKLTTEFASPDEELGKLRTTALPELPKQTSTAEFFVLFAEGKAVDAQFISGSDDLKAASGALLNARYDLSFPDDGPEKIARRGILSCSKYTSPSCEFVMLLPSTTRK